MRYRYEPSPEDVAQVRDDLKPFIHDPARYWQELADMLITFGLTLREAHQAECDLSDFRTCIELVRLPHPASSRRHPAHLRRARRGGGGAAGLRRRAPATTPCYRSRSRATGTSSSPVAASTRRISTRSGGCRP